MTQRDVDYSCQASCVLCRRTITVNAQWTGLHEHHCKPVLRGWQLIPADAERAACAFCGEDIASWWRDGMVLFWHRLPHCKGFVQALEPLRRCRIL